MQNQNFPSFFFTITMGELHGLCDGSITPCSNISSTSLLIMACMARLRGRYLCLIGVLSLSRMLCSTLLVGPRTFSNLPSSISRNSCSFSFSFVVCTANPPVALHFGSHFFIYFGRGGTLNCKRNCRSIPIITLSSICGRIEKLCLIVRFPTRSGISIYPCVSPVAPFARHTAPLSPLIWKPSVDSTSDVWWLINEISDPPSIRALYFRP